MRSEGRPEGLERKNEGKPGPRPPAPLHPPLQTGAAPRRRRSHRRRRELASGVAVGGDGAGGLPQAARKATGYAHGPVPLYLILGHYSVIPYRSSR